jgi:hypothetical protein
MHKAINLKVKLYIEGEDEPAGDFAKLTMRAVRDIIAAGQAKHPKLKVTIKRVAEDADDAEDIPPKK